MPPEVLTTETPILERANVLPPQQADLQTHVLRVRLDILTAFSIEKFENGNALLSLSPTEKTPHSVATIGQLGVKLSMDPNGTLSATQISRRKGEDWRDLRVESDLTAEDIERVLTGIFNTANWSAIPSSHLQH